MAIFKLSIEAIPATESEMADYYNQSVKKINKLLEQYAVRNDKGEIEKISVDDCKTLFTFNDFFQTTPLQAIFFKQKQQFVPLAVVEAFRSIVSEAPANIKLVFLNRLITLLTKKGWDKSLSAYFEKQYNFPVNGTVIVADLKDFSVGSMVYRLTFRLMMVPVKEITVFLKSAVDVQAHNELLYFRLQKQFLSTACYAKMPVVLTNTASKQKLLLSSLIPGVASDIVLTKLKFSYEAAESLAQKHIFKKAIEILIEDFLCHGVLGDLLGRNDRHLMNSLMTFVADHKLQQLTQERLNDPEQLLNDAKSIVVYKKKAISLIDFDLAWLLGEKNNQWRLADIDVGLSEINLLSLLAEFNDYNKTTNPFYAKRKAYIQHYFDIYCKKQAAILKNKDILFTEIKKIYPAEDCKKKTAILTQKIAEVENSKKSVIELFKRYLLNYRIRRVYKETLLALYKMAKETNHKDLFNALKKAKLLQYIPFQAVVDASNFNVFLQLQCFRGVFTKKDKHLLAEDNSVCWETVAVTILAMAKKYNNDLFNDLKDKESFIKSDTISLLEKLPNHEPQNKNNNEELKTNHCIS